MGGHARITSLYDRRLIRRPQDRLYKLDSGLHLAVTQLTLAAISQPMIIDSLQNAATYLTLHPRFQRAFEFIQSPEFLTLPAGKYELEGKQLYVGIDEYTTKAEGKGKWESHRKYIDIQLLIQGSERIYISPLEKMQQGEYDSAKDFLPLFGQGEFLTLTPGQFMIFFPQDAHMPSMAIDTPAPVKKAVVKVAVL